MPITVSHALSATTPDDPNYEIKPSNWNESHLFTAALVGSEVSGAFSNSGNVSFGLATNGFLTASANVTAAPSPVNISAGTASGNLQTVVFSNSHGVSFGLNGSTVTASHNGLTTAAQSNHSHGVTLALTNLAGTTGGNSNGITLSLSATAQSVQPVAFNAGAVSSNFSTLVFQDSNGVSFSNNAGSIRASVRTDYLTTARASNDAVGLNSALTAGPLAMTVNSAGLSLNAGSAAGTTSGFAGNLISGSMTHNTAGLNLSLNHPAWLTTAAQSDHSHGNPTLALTNLSGTTASNSAGLTLSLSAAAPGAGAGFTGGVSTGGNTSGQTGTQTGSIVFAGGNNITLSVATAAGGHQTITISGANAGGAQTGISGVALSNTTYSSGTISFRDLNGITWQSTTGQALQITHDLQYTSATSAITSNALHSSASRVSGIVAATNSTGGGTATLTGGVSFSNANGVSFYTSAGNAIVASIQNLSAGVTNAGNTSGNTGFVTGQFNLQGGNNITLSGSTNGGSMSVTVSAPDYAVSNSAGSFTFKTLNFSNANNVTFGTSAGGIITASVNAGGGGAAISGGANSQNTGTVNFANSNGITFGLSNNGTMTASHNGLTSQSNQAFSASGGSSAFQTLNFANSNGLTFSNSNGSVIASYTVPTQTAQTIGLYASSQTTGQSSSSTVDARSLTIVGQGNISVGLSGGSFIISQTGGAGANPAASASNGSFTFQTLGFSNANNVTFGTSAGSIITASVAAPGAAAEQNAINLLGNNTAGNTTATGSTIGLSGINLTLSGTNGSVVNISAPATSSLVGVSGISLSSNGSTVSILPAADSYFAYPTHVLNSQTWSVHGSTSTVFGVHMNGMHQFNHMRMLQSVSLSSMGAIATTANTTFSMQHDISHTVVLYSRGVGASSNSLQYVTSTSASQRAQVSIQANANGSQWSVTHFYSFPGSSTAQETYSTSYATTSASYQVSTTHLTRMTGMKFLAFPWNVTLPENDYWIGYGASSGLTTNGNASISRFSIATSNWAMTQINTTMGEWGNASNSSVQMQYGLGSFTTNATGSTASIPFANISSNASHPQPYVTFARIA